MINYKKICIVCGLKNPDKHHVKTRGSSGGDSEENLALLCRKHHTEIHAIGLSTFANKYDFFKKWLLSNGWEYIEHLNKWRHNG